MKRISQVAKQINISYEKLYEHIKKRGYILSKNGSSFWHLNKYQEQMICEDLRVEYIILESKMNNPDFEKIEFQQFKKRTYESTRTINAH